MPGNNYRHGHCEGGRSSGTYITWQALVNRCTNLEAPKWVKYGKAGITVCARWRKFENFLADMGTKPDGFSIDRIDNNKGYTPRNCRWATPQEQGQNRSTNRLTVADVLFIRANPSLSAPALAKRLNVSRQVVRAAATRQTWRNI